MLTCPTCGANSEVIGFVEGAGKGHSVTRRRKCARGHPFRSVETCEMSQDLEKSAKTVDAPAHDLPKIAAMNGTNQSREAVVARLAPPIKRILERRAQENFRSIGSEAAAIITERLRGEAAGKSASERT